jgi:hypothetical protein
MRSSRSPISAAPVRIANAIRRAKRPGAGGARQAGRDFEKRRRQADLVDHHEQRHQRGDHEVEGRLREAFCQPLTAAQRYHDGLCGDRAAGAFRLPDDLLQVFDLKG